MNTIGTIAIVAFLLLTAWCVQAMLAALHNAVNGVRIPRSAGELFKFLWYPYIVRAYRKDPEKFH